jgi:4-alpha-glucanotransferase
MHRRASGILLHVSSLPGEFGIGDLGPRAYRWIDFLSEAKQSYWQVLPLNPTTSAGHNSPYQPSSAFAGDPLLISPTLLRNDGLVSEDDLKDYPALPSDTVDYDRVRAGKRRLLDAAYERFKSTASHRGDLAVFCEEESGWLDDCALFLALCRRFPDRLWPRWPAPLRDKEASAIEAFARERGDAIEREKFFQYLFFKQWNALKEYANQHGVLVIGDLPYYVGYDSADVWGHAGLFKLDENKERLFLSGVPPDAFSDAGQLWGNPVYDWDRHEKTGYAWWIARLRRNLGLFDVVRVDHFRGFSAYWEVPAGRDTAVDGRWVKCPGEGFFRALQRYEPFPALIAEDLGVITPDVRELMRKYAFPGMKVLLFAFDGDTAANPYSLHNHVPDSVLYTGTHDNNTSRGWFRNDAGEEHIRRLADYLGSAPSDSTIHWDLIRLAMMSVCNVLVIPMQDALGLDENARMNRPAVESGNWEWRMSEGQATSELAGRLARLTEIYGRA